MSEIRIKNLNKTFHNSDTVVYALRNINLTIASGEIYGIIGMSGAGKSTLVRCMNYLEQPDDGKVFIGDQEFGCLKEKEMLQLRREIGMIFQNFNLLMQRNVLDNVCFPLQLKGIKKEEAHKKAMELLNTVGLVDKAGSYPVQLSGGQKQRVAIARALALEPRILLCDEATSALDPQTTASILNLLQNINQSLGITMVLITHQMSVIRQICGRVAIMKSGEIVEEGRVEEVFAHPKTETARYMVFSETQGLRKEEVI